MRSTTEIQRCRDWRSILVLLPVVLFCWSVTGCSLGVMAGKLLLGDPQQKSAFRAATSTDLTKGRDSLLIICSAPHGLLAQFPAVQVDIADRMTRILETRGVKIISSDQVATWYDEHGEWGDLKELAKAFDADFVMNVNLRRFTYRVPESDSLLQGSAEGVVSVTQTNDRRKTRPGAVFERSFQLKFPTSYPVPRENRSDQIFIEGFLDRLALHLAQFLYDHSASETVH